MEEDARHAAIAIARTRAECDILNVQMFPAWRKTEMEYFQIKLYYPTEMDALLKEVGFSHIKRVAAYDHKNLPSAQDYTIVYECIK